MKHYKRTIGLVAILVFLSAMVMAQDADVKKSGKNAGKKAKAKTPAVSLESVGKMHVYKKVGEIELKLYVVNPADWKADDKRPAIVFYHGGGFVGGSPNQFAEHAKYLALRGMVAVLVQYRFIAKKPAMILPIICIEDAKSAMRWVRGHAAELGIDSNRIASGGGSAGGYLAAFIGMIEGMDDSQDDIKISAKSNAMVLFNPLIDKEWGAFKFDTGLAKSKDFVPSENIRPDNPPAIIFFGSEDKLGRNVNDFKAGMEKVGGRCEVRMYEGQGHSFFNFGDGSNKYYYDTLKEADKFLASLGWLRGEPTLKEEETKQK